MKKVLVPFIITLAGCSQMSPIEKVSESQSHFQDAVYTGKDFYITDEPIDGEQYRIFHQGSSGFTATAVLRRSATKRANEFCRKLTKGSEMYTISEHTASPPYVFGNFPRIEIIFVCTPKINDIKIESNDLKVDNNDKYDQLLKIKELHDKGILNDKEFDAEKAKLLAL
ncbi:SHOCT domain-containing protein [Aliivibrio sifiae]|uniref:SHOCT domain-containing protein n=1 Tax=Aliivibrio sifiae TaxID=566293 RepID=A0A2S7X377_9GAMM|nr:SHOCT domain-containing protein [Aliivibrio sifiae]PQJ84488.1 hypothetical protein BTO22_13250 [Aliivibrio sifiae]